MEYPGDFSRWNYQMVDPYGNIIMTAYKDVWNLSDIYRIDGPNVENVLLCLSIVLGVDADNCSNF